MASVYQIFNPNGVNTLPQASWEVDETRLNGIAQNSVANSMVHNKIFKQTTTMAYAIGQWISARGFDATEVPTNLVNAFDDAIRSVARSAGPGVVYPETSTSATTRTVSITWVNSYDDLLNKVITIMPTIASQITTDSQIVTLNVNSLGEKTILIPDASNAEPSSSQTYRFRTLAIKQGVPYKVVYNGSGFVLINRQVNTASTTRYGITQLVDSVSNTSTAAFSAAPNAVKTAYDAAINATQPVGGFYTATTGGGWYKVMSTTQAASVSGTNRFGSFRYSYYSSTSGTTNNPQHEGFATFGLRINNSGSTQAISCFDIIATSNESASLAQLNNIRLGIAVNETNTSNRDIDVWAYATPNYSGYLFYPYKWRAVGASTTPTNYFYPNCYLNTQTPVASFPESNYIAVANLSLKPTQSYSLAGAAYNQANAAYTAANNAQTRAEEAWQLANNASSAEIDLTNLDPVVIGSSTVNAVATSIAIGGDAIADTQGSVAIGLGASVTSNDSGIAIGSCASTQAVGGVSIGSGANVWVPTGNSTYSIALGFNARVTNTVGNVFNSIAIGPFSSVGGSSSIAIGPNAIAPGSGSLAIGNVATANTLLSTAIGTGAYSNGSGALAVGLYSNCNTQSGIAMGNRATANGFNGVSIGSDTLASASDTIAIGTQSSTNSSNAISIGAIANANGIATIAIGANSLATDTGCIAIGSGSKANGNGTASVVPSIALGNRASTNGLGTIAIGSCSVAGTANWGNYATALGTNSYAGNIGTIAIGRNSYSAGSNTVVIGHLANAPVNDCVAIGNNVSVSTASGISIGTKSSTTGASAISIGRQAISTTNSIAIGATANAFAQYGVAIGPSCRASGISSTAIGNNAYSTLDGVAIGTNASSQGANSIALGRDSNANGGLSIALGQNSNTNNSFVIAIGGRSKALEVNTIAIGYNSSASMNGSTALGHYINVSACFATAIGVGACIVGNSNGSVALGRDCRIIDSASAVRIGPSSTLATTNASSYSVAVGASANVGVGGIGVGYIAGAFGANSIAIGSSANIQGATSIGIGYRATAPNANSIGIGLNTRSLGINSIAIGTATYASSTLSISIGANANTGAPASIAIGAYATTSGYLNSTAIGSYSASTVDSQIILGDANVQQIGGYTAWSNLSDMRDKADIGPIKDATGFIKGLNAVTYRKNYRASYRVDDEFKGTTANYSGVFDYDVNAHANAEKLGKRTRFGFLAQEVLKWCEEYYGKNIGDIVNDNFHDLSDKEKEGKESELVMQYSALIPVMVKSMQEMDERIARLEETVAKLSK